MTPTVDMTCVILYFNLLIYLFNILYPRSSSDWESCIACRFPLQPPRVRESQPPHSTVYPMLDILLLISDPSSSFAVAPRGSWVPVSELSVIIPNRLVTNGPLRYSVRRLAGVFHWPSNNGTLRFDHVLCHTSRCCFNRSLGAFIHRRRGKGFKFVVFREQ